MNFGTARTINTAADVTATMNGPISIVEGGPLVVTGPGLLVLTAANSYNSPTQISGGGTLSVASLANGGTASPIGLSTNAPGNLLFGNGTLRYTGGTVTTNRGFTLNAGGGTIDVTGAGTSRSSR